MKFGAYMRDKMYAIVGWVLMLMVVGLILVAFKVEVAAIIAVLVIFALGGAMVLAVEYWRKRKFYRELLGKIEQLDQAYLVLETMWEPEFYEGRLMWQALKAVDKSMTENVRRERERGRSFREYVEMWIHEVKRPLANLELVVENLWKSLEITEEKRNDEKIEAERKMRRNMRELVRQVEQVLYYVRSEDAEKDYLIRETELAEVVKKVGMRNMDDLLDNGVALEVEKIDAKVYTDAKWLEFVLNQIVNNSIKYRRKKGAWVKIRTKREKKWTILEVEDNGIGIPARDLPMVFEKTFTGENGRKGAASTGMGLYIAKNLCEKLGHKIEVESEVGKGTTVRLIFAENEFYEVAK